MRDHKTLKKIFLLKNKYKLIQLIQVMINFYKKMSMIISLNLLKTLIHIKIIKKNLPNLK